MTYEESLTTRSAAAEESTKRRSVGRPPTGSEDKRKRILIEATTLFAVSGYEGTSLNDIAKAAKISKAGLLHHFGSKEQLFVDVLTHRDAIDLAEWDDDPSSDPWQLLDQFVALVRKNQQRETLVKLFVSITSMGMNPDNVAHDWLKEHYAVAVSLFAGRLEYGKTIGRVHPDAPSEAIARLLMAASDGMQIQWLCGVADSSPTDNSIDMAEHIELLVSLAKERWALP